MNRRLNAPRTAAGWRRVCVRVLVRVRVCTLRSQTAIHVLMRVHQYPAQHECRFRCVKVRELVCVCVDEGFQQHGELS